MRNSMALMFLTALLLNLLFTVVLADIALGRYLDARLIEQIVAPPELPSLSPLLPNALPFLLLPNGAIRNGAFIDGRDTHGFVRRPDGTIPDGSFIAPFVNPPDDGDMILSRDAANELEPKESNPQDVRVYNVCDRDEAAGVLAQRGGDPREARLYSTWTDTQHSRGWYRVNGWWHYTWNGHALPILAPSGR